MSVASNGGTKFFCDLRGVRYYAPLRVLELGVIILDGERCLRLSWETASDANNGGLLVRALEDNMKRIVQGEVLRTLRRRNRKYKIVLHFWVLYFGLYQWTAHIVDIMVDWDRIEGRVILARQVQHIARPAWIGLDAPPSNPYLSYSQPFSSRE